MNMAMVCEFNENGYVINGKPVWLASGEFQYFRLTRGEWKKRLLQLKAAGFNTISVYFAWNYHEVTEGNWDFSGNKDVEAFLKMAAELEIFVIARPGPYICDEWECGGIPAWLSMRPGIRFRTADPQYLEYCDKWWDKIGPIIAKYQLDREGSIILVQMENEYGHGGEHQEADYIYHLRDGMRAYGVTVPMINCDSFIVMDRLKPSKWEGMNMCCNAGGDGLRVLARARKIQPDAPLMVAEYWITPFDHWGKEEASCIEDNEAIYGALEMVAGGAGGVTMFVFTGGSNFAYWNGRSICSPQNYLTTHYGGGAPILDDGLFSPKYNMFKKEFTGLMAAAEELSTAGMPELTGDMDGQITAVRRGKNAVFTFYINHSKEQMIIADSQKEQGAVDFSIPSGKVSWSVEHLPLKSGFIMESTNGKLFAGDPALVIYGNKKETVTIRLTDPETGREFVLTETVPCDDQPVVWNIEGHEKKLTVLLISEEATDSCYRLEMPGCPAVLVNGIERIEAIKVNDGKLEIDGFNLTADGWKVDAEGFGVWKPEVVGTIESTKENITDLMISRRFEESETAYDDSDWYQAQMPQPMAKFGSGNGWAWYRTTIEVPYDSWQSIYPSGAKERWMYFVDGEFKASRGMYSMFGENLNVYLTKGTHTLSILAENLGMYNTGFEMDMPLGEPKGIFGPVWQNGIEIQGWKMREGLRADAALDQACEIQRNDWNVMNEKQTDKPGFIRGTFRAPEGFEGAVRIITKDAGKGSVWINGFNIGRYWNVGPVYSVWIPTELLKAENEVVLFEQDVIDMDKVYVEFVSFGTKVKGTLKIR